MELISYGDKVRFISIKDIKKNTRIHFVLYKGKKNVKLLNHNLCYSRYNKPTDIVDEIEDMKTLKAILLDKDICSICLREFRFLFDNKYEDELELIKASKLKKSRLEKEKSLKQLN